MGNSDEIKVILDRLNDVKKALEVSNNKYNELIEVLDILELTSGLPLPNNKKSKMYPQKKILILLRNYLSTLYSLEKYTDRLFEYLDEGIKSYFYEECEDNSFRHEFLI
ncbi:MAG: hypothetical protein GYA51_14540, partial [Candidatus Methanofastidiosa archaeon]|nr:hypothetical protein [Candidatus Methanofastidiosa archaeon]